MMIFRMSLEMLGEIRNLLAQNGDLNFRGTRICRVRLKGFDYFRFSFYRQ